MSHASNFIWLCKDHNQHVFDKHLFTLWYNADTVCLRCLARDDRIAAMVSEANLSRLREVEHVAGRAIAARLRMAILAGMLADVDARDIIEELERRSIKSDV